MSTLLYPSNDFFLKVSFGVLAENCGLPLQIEDRQ